MTKNGYRAYVRETSEYGFIVLVQSNPEDYPWWEDWEYSPEGINLTDSRLNFPPDFDISLPLKPL